MHTSRKTRIGVVVAVVALATAGAAFGAARYHGSGPSPSSTAPAVGDSVAYGGLRYGARGGDCPGRGPGGDLAAAASYLGISESTLLSDLQSGKTLAQVADATSGKSAAGLVDALVQHPQQELDQAVTDGRLTQAQADQLKANLKTRITAMVNGQHPAGPPPGMGLHGPHMGFGMHAGARI